MISILMPVRDEADFLEECLNSIQPPAGVSTEVILVDDHSYDHTHTLATKISAQRDDILITVLRNSGHGKAAALNQAYSQAQGDVFLMLAGDDLLASEALPDRISAVAGSAPALAQCRYRSFSDNHAHDGILFPRYGRKNHLAGGAVSFNRAFARFYFPIPETLPNEDTWLWAIATLYESRARPIDRVGLHYRLHSRNSTGPALDFAQTTDGLARRHAAFSLAAGLPVGTEKGRAQLVALTLAEAYRQAGSWWRIIGLHDIPLSERAMFCANATPFLFSLKRMGMALHKRLWRFWVD